MPPKIQVQLLSNLFHHRLVDEGNFTNVHKHHVLPYEALKRHRVDCADGSFFDLPPDSDELFQPHDKHFHKPFSAYDFFSSKFRWMTLGGQYDWTLKEYPKDKTTPFPSDIANFVRTLFSDVRPEAAIMNVYKSGDYLSMHRDVSEECDNPLVSFSFGCDGIFIAGLQSEEDTAPRYVVLRLHSGDAIYLSGPSRFAWHGVPQILANTCPDWLKDWPYTSELHGDDRNNFAAWRGWMANKRVNLSVRQIES